MRIQHVVIFSLATLTLSACFPTSLNSGAASVKVLSHEPGNNCQLIGDVTGSQGNFFTGRYTTDRSLQEGALNDLKNEAAKKGGNAIHILMGGGHQTKGEQTNVTYTANVYKCLGLN